MSNSGNFSHLTLQVLTFIYHTGIYRQTSSWVFLLKSHQCESSRDIRSGVYLFSMFFLSTVFYNTLQLSPSQAERTENIKPNWRRLNWNEKLMTPTEPARITALQSRFCYRKRNHSIIWCQLKKIQIKNRIKPKELLKIDLSNCFCKQIFFLKFILKKKFLYFAQGSWSSIRYIINIY